MLLGYISQASNIKTRENSPYTKENFLAFYPQFTDLLPEVVLDSFVELGHACVSEARYGKMWKLAIGLFIAHFCSLYLSNVAEAGTPAEEVLAKGKHAYLLCSDGFWEYVLESEMEEDLRFASDPEDWLARMRKRLRERIPENNDNNTAAVVWLTQE